MLEALNDWKIGGGGGDAADGGQKFHSRGFKEERRFISKDIH